MVGNRQQSATPMRVGSEDVQKLMNLIRRSLRVTKTERPVFEDVGGVVDQILLDTDHVVYGRRGSGKSSLLLSAYWVRFDRGEPVVYLDAQECRGLSYPDTVLSIVVEVLCYLDKAIADAYSSYRGWVARLMGKDPASAREHLRERIAALETERHRPEEYPIEEETVRGERQSESLAANVGARIPSGLGAGVQLGSEVGVETTRSQRRSLTQAKADYIEGIRPAIGRLIDEALSLLPGAWLFLEVDDFYFIDRQMQAYVIDYLYRLTKHRPIHLKIATIRHRSLLYQRTVTGTVGVLSRSDVQAIDLDRTLEDKGALAGALFRILEALAQRAGIANPVFDELLTEGARELLVDACGGVPRDFLAIFVQAHDIASMERRDSTITKWAVGEAARRHLEETKREVLDLDAREDRGEVEEVLAAIVAQILYERRATVFLLDKAECEQDPDAHQAVKTLLDMRFLHLVAGDTSASYGGGRRYEAYLLDPGIWAAPRPRHLHEVRYERTDSRGRRDELRNAPALPLAIVSDALRRVRSGVASGTDATPAGDAVSE